MTIGSGFGLIYGMETNHWKDLPKSHIIAADMDASAISYLEFQNKRQAQEISDLFFTLIIRKRFSWF